MESESGPMGWISKSDLRLPVGYQCRETPAYFPDEPDLSMAGIWQPDVYPFAAAIAGRLGVGRLVDLGCGNGEKLAGLSGEYEVLGVDFGANLASARQTYPELTWIDLDLQSNLPDISAEVNDCMVICSDVIEHLMEPAALLRFLQSQLPRVHGIVISTPDRHRARGTSHLGPPDNPAHTMEWSRDEFYSLLTSHGLNPLVHGWTRNHSGSATRATQVAFIPGGLSGLTGAWERPSTIAYVPCYNERDVVVLTVSRLLLQGLDVHVLDNWSSDGTWDDLQRAYADEARVTLERFPSDPEPEFNWAALLERIDDLAAATDHEWIIHVDADEQLDAFEPTLGLLDVLGIAGLAGYDVVDCTLIDFRPVPGDSSSDLPSRWEFATRSGARMLERAWRNRGSRVGIASSGGHALAVSKRVFPLNLVLRHFPLRSPDQARRKIFDERLPRYGREREERGWHVQYDGFTPESSFLWPPDDLKAWEWTSPREWAVELSTRVAIPFEEPRAHAGSTILLTSDQFQPAREAGLQPGGPSDGMSSDGGPSPRPSVSPSPDTADVATRLRQLAEERDDLEAQLAEERARVALMMRSRRWRLAERIRHPFRTAPRT